MHPCTCSSSPHLWHCHSHLASPADPFPPSPWQSPHAQLPPNAIKRYARQILVPEIGLQGQRALLDAAVLVVGAGGLGCPALLYLATSGIGRLGIVDGDNVEETNLHRQILHADSSIGHPKVLSARRFLVERSPNLVCITHLTRVTPTNALSLLSNYDVVLDCTDNVKARLVLNDACVLLNKPLVFGSALRTEGQLTVYHYNGGPCYRCLHPQVPRVVLDCASAGVLGPAVGVIGSLQAAEAIKVLCKGDVLSARMMIADIASGGMRTVRLRGRQPSCSACGDHPSMVVGQPGYEGLLSEQVDEPCGQAQVKSERVSVQEYRSIRERKQPHILIDCRSPPQFAIGAIHDAINIPLNEIATRGVELVSQSKDLVVMICKSGVTSVRAVNILSAALPHVNIVDVRGGMIEWCEAVDGSIVVC